MHSTWQHCDDYIIVMLSSVVSWGEVQVGGKHWEMEWLGHLVTMATIMIMKIME